MPSLRSAPEQNARPAPVSMTARTSSSAATSRSTLEQVPRQGAGPGVHPLRPVQHDLGRRPGPVDVHRLVAARWLLSLTTVMIAIGMAKHEPRDRANRAIRQVVAANSRPKHAGKAGKAAKKAYEAELYRLQAELVKMQNWTRTSGARIVVIFEGRDAAGKGGTISRVTQYLNPRFARDRRAATSRPSGRAPSGTSSGTSRTCRRPARSSLFDRSWYNRAGVEHVMGFCTKEEYARFMHQCPIFERMLVEDGILLRKYWFSVSDSEQQERFESRLDDPVRRWKLSPMDLESISRWEDVLAGEGRHVHDDRHPGGAVVRGRVRRQAAGADQHDRAPAVHDPVPRRARAEAEAAAPARLDRLRPDSDRTCRRSFPITPRRW